MRGRVRSTTTAVEPGFSTRSISARVASIELRLRNTNPLKTAVEGSVTKRERLPHPDHPVSDRAQCQHLDDRVQTHRDSAVEVGRSRPTTQVENRARCQHFYPSGPPSLLLAQRENAIDQVVSGGDPGEDRVGDITHGSMTSNPVYRRSASGMTTDPSGCWWFSSRARMVRPTAQAVPLRVCTTSFPLSALVLILRRRA